LGDAWRDTLRNLPPHYKGELVRQWNTYLSGKYASTGALKEAWNRGSRPMGPNIIRNGKFLSGVLAWNLETHDSAQARMIAEKYGEGQPVAQALRVNVVKIGGEAWHIQLHQQALNLVPGETYTVSFWAKSEQSRNMGLYSGLAVDPWSHVGLDKTVALTPEWAEYS